MVILHIRVHRIIKVYGFIICRVISQNTSRRLDTKRGSGGRTREKMRVIGSMIGVIGLIRWIRRYLSTSKEGMILRVGGKEGLGIRVMILIGTRARVRYSIK